MTWHQADMIDVHLLLKKLRRVEDDIEHLRTVSSQAGEAIDHRQFGRPWLAFPARPIEQHILDTNAGKQLS